MTPDLIAAAAKLFGSNDGLGAWQPIATAPRDGTEVLVLLDVAGQAVVHIAWYRSREEWESRGIT